MRRLTVLYVAMCGQYNHKEFKGVIIRKNVKDELDSLSKDMIKVYHIKRERDVTYSKVIKCLMEVPAESIRSKASGVQELVTSIIFNGSGAHPIVAEHAG